MMPQRSPCSSHTGRVLACRVRIVRATCCHLSVGATWSGLPVITSRALTASPGTAAAGATDPARSHRAGSGVALPRWIGRVALVGADGGIGDGRVVVHRGSGRDGARRQRRLGGGGGLSL